MLGCTAEPIDPFVHLRPFAWREQRSTPVDGRIPLVANVVRREMPNAVVQPFRLFLLVNNQHLIEYYSIFMKACRVNSRIWNKGA